MRITFPAACDPSTRPLTGKADLSPFLVPETPNTSTDLEHDATLNFALPQPVENG